MVENWNEKAAENFSKITKLRENNKKKGNVFYHPTTERKHEVTPEGYNQIQRLFQRYGTEPAKQITKNYKALTERDAQIREILRQHEIK